MQWVLGNLCLWLWLISLFAYCKVFICAVPLLCCRHLAIVYFATDLFTGVGGVFKKVAIDRLSVQRYVGSRAGATKMLPRY